MRKRLLKREYLKDPQVEQFYCGPLDRDIEIADALRYQSIDDVEAGNLLVWLYYTDHEELIGFTSLGKTEWGYPKPNGTKKTVQIIPNLALAVRFQGEPTDESEPKFSRQIMDDVIAEAIDRVNVSNLLGLFVHVENAKAISLYRGYGFEEFGRPREYTHGSFQRMVLKLPQ